MILDKYRGLQPDPLFVIFLTDGGQSPLGQFRKLGPASERWRQRYVIAVFLSGQGQYLGLR